MIYLDTNMYGEDPTTIVFPSVQTCMALVIETAAGLIGVHLSSDTQNLDARAAHIGAHLATMGPLGIQHLYGITHRNRFSPGMELVQLKSQLRCIAAAVHYAGTITGILLPGDAISAATDDIKATRNHGGGCQIGYVKSKGTVNTTVVPGSTPHRTIHAVKGVTNLYGGDDNQASIAIGLPGNPDFGAVTPDMLYQFPTQAQGAQKVGCCTIL